MRIYHNPRCSKSREALELIKTKTKNLEIIEYTKKELSAKEITSILSQLKLTPIDLIRKNEPIWKEQFKGKKLSNNDLITIMTTYPKLIQRPIIITKNKAIIGRPIEKVESLFD